jgi:hypothetical protein
LTGSRQGLLKFRDALVTYCANPANAMKSEHEHYGPYMYLKIMTWPEAGCDHDAIRGSLDDLRRLAQIVDKGVSSTAVGSALHVHEEFADRSPYGLVLQIREDGFDPASADPGLSPDGAG